MISIKLPDLAHIITHLIYKLSKAIHFLVNIRYNLEEVCFGLKTFIKKKIEIF